MNIPAFLTEKLTAQVGEETARRIFAGFEAKRKTTLRVNRLKAEPMQILKALADAGLSAQRVPWSGDALILDHADEGAVAALPMFESGEIYMQSLSSMIPPLVLGAQPEENILDMATCLSDHGKAMWIRHVLVPGITDDDGQLHRLRAFIDTLKTVERVEILPYHTLGVFKWKELGIPYALEDVEPPTKEQVEHAREIIIPGYKS